MWQRPLTRLPPIKSGVADPGKLLRAGWQPTIDTRAGLAALVGRGLAAGRQRGRTEPT